MNNLQPLNPSTTGIQKNVNPHSIPLQQGIQVRVALSGKTVRRYADMMRGGTEFDPVQVVVTDARRVRLVDGFHRVRAAMEAGRGVQVEVKHGTEFDAIKAALGANARHGLQLKKRDHRNGYRMAWEESEEFRRLSLRRKEELTGIPKSTLSRWEAAFRGDMDDVRTAKQVDVPDLSRLKRQPALERLYGQFPPPPVGGAEARRLAVWLLEALAVTPEELCREKPKASEYATQAALDALAEQAVGLAAQMYLNTADGNGERPISESYVEDDVTDPDEDF